MHPLITPELLRVARGDAPADLVIRGGRIVNVFTGGISEGDIAISDGRIASVGVASEGAETITLAGAYVAPGFIDAHMHVESTMMPPSEFVRLAAPHGTTGVVLDPHEIANVQGLDGIRAIMANAGDLGAQPIEFMFTLSSCVPSCHLETSGATISAADLEPLFDDERVVALAEMMNFPGVVSASPDVLEKINLGLSRRIVDGHAPGLRGRALQAYVASGISSDHESFSLEEAAEKLRLGMQIYIREGSAAKNLRALLPLINDRNAWRFCFCTDDRHPADLKDEGHIDHIVRQAIGLGLDPVRAITIASLNAATHYRRADLGAIAPGRWANLIVFNDLSAPAPRMTFARGNLIAREGECLLPSSHTPESTRASFPATPIKMPTDLAQRSFHIPPASSSEPRASSIRVIAMDPHQLITGELIEESKLEGGAMVSDVERDILKLAVIERHTGSGSIGLGFVKGFGLKRGAIASTVGHDAHNLAVLGVNDGDMLVAARSLAEAGGGQCAVENGEVIAVMPLPIAGLMSDQPADVLIEQQARLLEATRALGCPHHDPFMPLSFMPLPVIPKLKLSDQGLVDVEQFEIVPLVVD